MSASQHSSQEFTNYANEIEETSSAQTMNLKDIVAILRRNRTIIAVMALMGVVGGVLFIVSQTPLYTATSTVQINVRANRVVNIESVISSIGADDTAIVSELDVLQSRPMAARVIRRLGLEKDPEFSGGGFSMDRILQSAGLKKDAKTSPQPKEAGSASAPQPGTELSEKDSDAGMISTTKAEPKEVDYKITNQLLSHLKVKRRPKSYSIDIEFTSRSADKARIIANAIAEEYINSQLEEKYEATRRANAWLSVKLAELQESLRESEHKVQKYKEENNLNKATGGLTLSDQQLSEINTQLVEARAARTQAQARLTNSRVSVDSIPEVLNSSLIQMLRGQEAEVLRKKADLSNRYGERHPRMINVNAELKDIDSKIRSEMRRIIQSLEQEVGVAKDREEAIEKSLQELQGTSDLSNRAAIELAELEREMNANRALYESFLSRFKQTSEGTGTEQADAKIVSMATVPPSPSYPRKEIVLPIAFIAGLLVGMWIAFILEALDHSYRTAQDLERTLGLPVVGMIPEEDLSKATKNLSLLYREAVKTSFVTMNLALNKAPEVIMITSSIPAEGKTFFAAAFAQVLAKSGRKVLLMDGDMRRAKLTRQLLRRSESGLDQLLTGEKTLDQVICKELRHNLDLIPCRCDVMESQELIASESMVALMTELRQRYDYILMDTPPVMALSDTLIASKVVDCALFMVRWGHTPRELVKASLKTLAKTALPVALVINRVDLKRHGSYGYGDTAHYYGQYKEYYLSEDAA